MKNTTSGKQGSGTGCAGCEWLMFGRWAPWCSKARTPLLFVKECPCPRERVFYESANVHDMVERARGMNPGDEGETV